LKLHPNWTSLETRLVLNVSMNQMPLRVFEILQQWHLTMSTVSRNLPGNMKYTGDPVIIFPILKHCIIWVISTLLRKQFWRQKNIMSI
jgi:hypothetical protein